MQRDKVMNRDYTLILDKSGSMATTDVAGKSRWFAAQESTLAFAHKIGELDPDGMTVYAFNNAFKRYDGVTADKVKQVFTENEPGGGTDLAGVLKHAVDDFLKRKAAGTIKTGDTILVVTDGEPNDQAAVGKVICDATKQLDNDDQLAIQFLQIGKDAAAQTFLHKLDDNIVGAKFDIVDTKTFDEIEQSGMTMTDMLLAAIQD